MKATHTSEKGLESLIVAAATGAIDMGTGRSNMRMSERLSGEATDRLHGKEE